jgi:RND family efflux transporter MFP subunit
MDHDDEVIDDTRRRPVRGRLRRSITMAITVAALLLVGAAAGVVWSERRGSPDARSKGASPAASGGHKPSPTPEDAVEVTLTPEALQRTGIKVAEVKSQPSAGRVMVPGTITSNAYRDTKVNTLVGGIVRQVAVELGSSVRRGQALSVIFSAELADAQMKYLSTRAMLEADRQKLERTQKLVALGSVSRQELEEVTAVHASRETEVAAAGQRLLLLGLTPDRLGKLTSAAQVVSEVTVPAPADGLVIARAVNPGQVINAGQELFAVTDLSTVWAIGDLYERDFPRVRVGAPASVAIPSVPGRTLKGRVAYIDPRVDAATRTAKVRVEVPNPAGDLRLGMFVTVNFETGSTERVTVVPRTAIQMIGERPVVYVAAEGEEGKFTERTVKLGTPVGDSMQVLDGLKPGEKVVSEGSFFLRAEATRTRSGG